MKIFKTIGLIWAFYKNFLLLSTIITACCIMLFWEYGFSIFNMLFWFKLGTLAITYYFINDYKKKEYYYYQNLGVSKVLLWTTTLSFDFILSMFLIIQTYKFK
jgi:hypothetical protein